LKARFAALCGFYENLKQPHLPKMRTIGAASRRFADGAPDKPRPARVTDRHSRAGPRVNPPFTMQRMIHHSTRHSPSCANGDGDRRETRGSAGENTGARPALAFV
jgi:hypothetical protein